MSQYRNIDITGPEQVRITWRMETPRDDSGCTPDERDDGFWPSNDPDAAGYVLPENFYEQYRLASERMEAWRNDEWEYIGVVAVAEVAIPIGGHSYTLHTFRSAGLWGIESDSGAYLKEVYEDEKSALFDQLTTLAAAIGNNSALITDESA